MNRLLGIWILTILLPLGAMGHGRNSTVVRAEIERTRALVRIEAVITDLLTIYGIGLGEWAGYAEPAREAALMEAAERMLGGFKVIQDSTGELRAELLGVEMPEGKSDGNRWWNPEQQSLTMSLQYVFSTMPETLTFWQICEDSRIWDMIHCQLIIRRLGELVMFPAALGDGLPVSRSFNWEQEPVSMEESTNLDFAVCDWKNRPANAVLNIEGERISWRLFIPLARYGGIPGTRGSYDSAKLAGRLCAGLDLKVDGQPVPWTIVANEIRPMVGHSHHGIPVDGESSPMQAMMDLELTALAGHAPETVEVGCFLFGDQLPVLYNALIAGHENLVVTMLTPESPNLVWNNEK